MRESSPTQPTEFSRAGWKSSITKSRRYGGRATDIPMMTIFSSSSLMLQEKFISEIRNHTKFRIEPKKMLLTYILWFLGIVCGLITAVEIAIIIYRLYNKNKNVKTNIIIAVITAVLAIGFSSSAVISVFDKVIKSNNTSLSEIGKEFGKASADITANAYQGFVETWDETVKEKDVE